MGSGGKRKELIKEKMIRLRKEGSLLDGARVPRFPSYIYILYFLGRGKLEIIESVITSKPLLS